MFFFLSSKFYIFMTNDVLTLDICLKTLLNNCLTTTWIIREDCSINVWQLLDACLTNSIHLMMISKNSLMTTAWRLSDDYSRVRNKHTGTLINFWGFFQGYVYWFLIFKKLFKNFLLSFPLAMHKRVKLSAIWEEATFIQGAMFIIFAKYSRGYVYWFLI